MKTAITTTCLIAGLAFQLHAEEIDPSIAGLEKTAEKFIIAYNHQDAAALAALFTENGEITNLSGDDTVSGRVDIQANYEDIFDNEDAPSIALEVSSVRLVAPGLAIEDGTFHLTPPGDESAPTQSTTYTAVLVKNDAGEWQIASSRGLKDVTEAAGVGEVRAGGLEDPRRELVDADEHDEARGVPRLLGRGGGGGQGGGGEDLRQQVVHRGVWVQSRSGPSASSRGASPRSCRRHAPTELR